MPGSNGTVTITDTATAFNGGTVSNPLVLPGDPTAPLQAATKQYVDAHAGSGGVTYEATANTAVQGNDPRIVNAVSRVGGGPISSFGSALHLYGDSNTCGYLLASGNCNPGSTIPNNVPSSSAWPGLMGADLGITVQNAAVSGDQACDLWPHQIALEGENPSAGNAVLYGVMDGTNDAQVKNTGAYESVFNLCDQGAKAWLALPSQFKVLPGSATITTSGSTACTANYVGQMGMLETDAQGASVSIPVTLKVAGPVYLFYVINDGSTGSWTYSVGGVTGSGTTGTSPAISTQNSTTSSMALLRIPNVPAGAKTLVITQTSTRGGGFGLYGVGVPPQLPTGEMPTVVVGYVPNPETGNPTFASEDNAYNADVAANIALLQGDRLDVRANDNRPYMTGSAAEMTNSQHPNAVGAWALANSFEQAFRAIGLASANQQQQVAQGSPTCYVQFMQCAANPCNVDSTSSLVYVTATSSVNLPTPTLSSSNTTGVQRTVTINATLSTGAVTVSPPSGYTLYSGTGSVASFPIPAGQSATFTAFAASGATNWILNQPLATATQTGPPPGYEQFMQCTGTTCQVDALSTIVFVTAGGTTLTSGVQRSVTVDAFIGSATVVAPSGYTLYNQVGQTSSISIATGHSAKFVAFSAGSTVKGLQISAN